MRRLVETLDDEVRVLEALVRVTQKEQQHLLAIEPAGLDIVLAEKQRLLETEDGLRQERERLTSHRPLRDVIESAPPALAERLTVRRGRLLALLAALSELNAVAAFHAHRQLRWASACRRSVEPAQAARHEAYGPSGKPAGPGLGAGLVLNASV